METLMWADLLGVPWELHGKTSRGMDCSTLAEEVLCRLGKTPPPTSPFRLPDTPGTENEMGSYFEMMEEAYELVGEDAAAATRAGDLVLAADRRGIARHLYVMVNPDRGTLITVAHRNGVIAVRRFTIRDVVGVYRLREEDTA